MSAARGHPAMAIRLRAWCRGQSGAAGSWWPGRGTYLFAVAPPPTPGVAEKAAPARHRGSVYFSAIRNFHLKTGGTGKTGGHDF